MTTRDLVKKSLTSHESTCPFCRQPNNCQAHETSDCWCNQVVFPAELLNLVPPALQRRACICRSCLEAFQRDPQGFAAAHAAPSVR